jgi:protein arginine N-methyltransferase 1
VLRQDAVVHGFAVWWVAELVPGVALSTAPDAPATHWEQLYFPLASSLAGRAGETIRVRISSRSSRETGTTLAWSALRQSADGRTLERRAHDLDKGYLP